MRWCGKSRFGERRCQPRRAGQGAKREADHREGQAVAVGGVKQPVRLVSMTTVGGVRRDNCVERSTRRRHA